MRTLLVALLPFLFSLAEPAQAETLYFIHVDHLGTPRLAIGEDGVERWRWDNLEPFGDNPPIEVMGTEGYLIDLPLRFPGQYADKETNLAYNMARDYASDTGRYIQSDPIGLAGGLNTYAYVGARPLLYSDPKGLWMPWIHKMMTEEALARVDCRIDPLPLATANVDTIAKSQAPGNAHWHHMRQQGQSDAEAHGNYDQYLALHRSSCDSGDLARVLHAQQDSTSPGHKGMPAWTDEETPLQLVRHGASDAFPNWNDWNEAVAKSVSEIAAFKAHCPCVCR